MFSVQVNITHFLVLSAILFCLGLYAALTRKNMILVLIGIELMLNAAIINLAAFNTYYPQAIDGQMAALFAIVLAAASVAVALAIIIKVYQHVHTVNTDGIDKLKD